MSETLRVWPEIKAICEKAGLDPVSIDSMMITPESVQFAVLMEPIELTEGGRLAVNIVTHPWTRGE